MSLMSPALAGSSLPLMPPGEMPNLQATGTAKAEMLAGPRGAGFCTRQQDRAEVRDETPQGYVREDC